MRALLFFTLLGPAAYASGFYYPDLGAVPLGRGATGAAGAGDLSALHTNPAGLAELDGLHVQAELSIARQAVSFTRGGICGTGTLSCPTVENGGGPFLNTVSGVAFHLGRASPALAGLVVALGVYGPPSVGHLQFPDPRTARGSPQLSAPQRYSLINSANFVLYPGLGVGYRALPWLDVGATVQVRTARLKQARTIFASTIGGDVAEFDAIATADATDAARLAFGIGAIVRPAAGLSVGASFRPMIPVHADGTLDVVAPLAQTAGITVEGNRSKVDLIFPAEARLGVRWANGPFAAAAEVEWEGWGALREIVVTPVDIVIKQGGEPTKLGPIQLTKKFHGSFSFRFGGEWSLPQGWFPQGFGIVSRIGGIYEGSAIPDQALQVDFPNMARAALTLGATLRVGPVGFTLGFAHYFQVDKVVTDSEALRPNPFPSATPFVVGNGNYSSSLDLLALQLVWTFGR